MSRIIYTLMLCFWMLSCYAWNMQGHQVIAQIAYDNLTPSAKKMCLKYLDLRKKKSLELSFIAASIWADQIKFKHINWYDSLHYIDIPFSHDGTALPSIEKTNAVWAINHASLILASKKTNLGDKQLALRILIHVVGDIHQPLHAATKVSHQLPNGDLGGNLFPLGANNIADNLHKYWDQGAGFFMGNNKIPGIKNKARLLEKKWSCSGVNNQKKPEQWASASHHLAVNQAYQLNAREIPGRQYQTEAQNTIQKQTLIAGCQVAILLNELAKHHS